MKKNQVVMMYGYVFGNMDEVRRSEMMSETSGALVAM